MQVTVAVVSWNTRELLVRCLASLEGEVAAGRAEVWVVDNGSGDGSAGAARRHAPWATVLEPGSNLGFGRAVNLVAGRTRTPWLACANADVALEAGALQAMLAAATDPGVGCVAPRLILPDGSTEYSLHSLPTIPFTLAFNLGLHRASRRLADRMLVPGRYAVDRPRAAPWAIGALLLLRRTAFEQVGGFDEQQWVYAEDLDLCWRLRRGGWDIRYEPGARVRHVSGAATGMAFGEAKAAHFMRATYRTLLRRRGPARARCTALINLAGSGVRVAWMSPLAMVSRRWRAPLDENRRWFAAHLEGLRPRTSLMGQEGQP